MRHVVGAAWMPLVFTLLAVAATPEYGFRVVRTFPHDRSAFTEGFEFRGGYFYESTGQMGRSTLRKVEVESGRVVQGLPLSPSVFGEGVTVLNQQIVQLTYQGGLGFVYSQPDFRLLRTFRYNGEGWGLANDGRTIYMSDGTSGIRCLDPVSLRELRRLQVHEGAEKIQYINELEIVQGEIWANVWQTEKIARISPQDGRILGWIDLSGLLPAAEARGVDVMNGIAYDAMGDRLFVTGKYWPKVFEIKVVPKAPGRR
ncbi:glutaminyl-peptide cyclotransferase [uncultured Paludibaculum sp.]|uniref:glutaminyl-peptide cyclotransferase n=1 Tax=uncultured Paludibaculum sp. TaxID=1765020 RepID=UPI002AAB0AEA|nr:glutaminyl-peptide cyclotransferase [uncultured Paludibaculum sp.]